MIPLSVTLSYYKRRDIQEEIIKAAENREIAVRYGDKFGNRPDVLNNPNDILELAKQNATSFHASEELWQNPLQLGLDMKKHEIDELRIGWDLVLDVDFEAWEATKLIADALVGALKAHGIKSISAKFSGNKGFHIGVPFEAFPKKIVVEGKMQETKNLFPESVRRIAVYLIHYIDNKENNFRLSEKIMSCEGFNDFIKESGKSIESFTTEICMKCSNTIKKTDSKKKAEFVCAVCGRRIIDEGDNEFIQCPKCKKLMKKFDNTSKKTCSKCGGHEFRKKINLKIDTVLISSRHLFRSVYSLHEKSGLVSVPLDPDKIMEFDKKSSAPEKIGLSKFVFLDRGDVKQGEGKKLITEAFDFNPHIEEDSEKTERSYEEIKDAIPEQFFPPCISGILKGMKDGKKRALFALVNFLSSIGWTYEKIEERLVEWNKANEEPLREVYIKGHLRYAKQNKKKVLPPNCQNEGYYKDFGVCSPDNLCARIKNPVNYAVSKTRYLNKEGEKRNKKPKN
jgi:DNA primase catalytic subunit